MGLVDRKGETKMPANLTTYVVTGFYGWGVYYLRRLEG